MTMLFFYVWRFENMTTVLVAKVKSHLSELIAKSSHAHERFVITLRNKPVAACFNYR